MITYVFVNIETVSVGDHTTLSSFRFPFSSLRFHSSMCLRVGRGIVPLPGLAVCVYRCSADGSPESGFLGFNYCRWIVLNKGLRCYV